MEKEPHGKIKKSKKVIIKIITETNEIFLKAINEIKFDYLKKLIEKSHAGVIKQRI